MELPIHLTDRLTNPRAFATWTAALARARRPTDYSAIQVINSRGRTSRGRTKHSSPADVFAVFRPRLAEPPTPDGLLATMEKK
jgi:hypothetical protein